MAGTRLFRTTRARLRAAYSRSVTMMGRLAVLAALSACSSEGYDTGDGSLSWLRCDFAVAYTDASRQVQRLVTDDGATITPSQGVSAQWMLTPDSAYRVQAYYDSQTSRVVSLAQVLTLQPIGADQVSDRKADPLKYESIWLSANGQYVNMGLGVMAGTTQDADAALQRLWLVDMGVSLHADGRTTHTFLLCHDQAGVPQYYTVRQYVSVPTQGIQADSMSIIVPTYSGTHTATIGMPR